MEVWWMVWKLEELTRFMEQADHCWLRNIYKILDITVQKMSRVKTLEEGGNMYHQERRFKGARTVAMSEGVRERDSGEYNGVRGDDRVVQTGWFNPLATEVLPVSISRQSHQVPIQKIESK